MFLRFLNFTNLELNGNTLMKTKSLLEGAVRWSNRLESCRTFLRKNDEVLSVWSALLWVTFIILVSCIRFCVLHTYKWSCKRCISSGYFYYLHFILYFLLVRTRVLDDILGFTGHSHDFFYSHTLLFAFLCSIIFIDYVKPFEFTIR